MWLFRNVIFLCIFGLPIESKAYDGNELLQGCKEAVYLSDDAEIFDHYLAGYCTGMLRGVLDINSVHRFMHEKSVFCFPENVTIGQLAKVVIKEIESHPETLHKSDSELVLMSLAKYYRCQS